MWLETLEGRQLVADGFWCGSATSGEEMVAIASAIGTAVSSRPSAPVLQRLTPVAPENAPAQSLSADHGLASFPFHTDGAHHRRPPHWVLMRCVDPGPENRPTLLADTSELSLQARQWRDLERAVWWVHSGGRAFLTSVVREQDRRRVVRYDRGCMRPAVGACAGIADFFESAIEKALQHRLNWRQGDLVIFDNWRMLHARAAADGHDAGIRVLERVLVQ